MSNSDNEVGVRAVIDVNDHLDVRDGAAVENGNGMGLRTGVRD